MEKATFRLPGWQLDRLRAESEQQQRSVNSVMIDVIARGLGQPSDSGDLVRTLGPLVARPPLAQHEFNLEPVVLQPKLDEALDWGRGDR
jgi:hypothetical protein